MIDVTPTAEDSAIRDSVRSFVTRELLTIEEEILSRSLAGGPEWLEAGERRELQAAARSAGLWGVNAPAEHGGAGLSAVQRALVAAELGRTWLDFQFGGSAHPALYLLNQEQQSRYLAPSLEGRRTMSLAISEAEAGSDVARMQTTATRDGDGWVLNGIKTWISRGNDADFAVVLAKTVQDDTQGITAFLADRDLGWTSAPIPMMTGAPTATLTFHEVRVPDTNVVGAVNGGLAVAMASVYRHRYLLAARAVGAAERLLEMALDHARSRVTFGKTLSDRENVQWMLADSEVEIRATRLLMLQAAALHQAGGDYRHAACAAKLFGARMVNKVVDSVVQLHGAMACARGYPLERWYRQLRAERLIEGSDEINRRSIARNLLRGHVRVGAM